MRNLLRVIIFSLVLFNISCSVIKKSPAEQARGNQKISGEPPAKNFNDIYFKASGNEPFWLLEISEQQIKLKMITDSIAAPYTEVIRAADRNVKLYKTKTATEILNIQIIQNECTNEMSGNVLPYSVSVEYQKKGADKFEKIMGCGQYITDYRLNDIWVLEAVNGNKMEKKDFSNELPSMEK